MQSEGPRVGPAYTRLGFGGLLVLLATLLLLGPRRQSEAPPVHEAVPPTRCAPGDRLAGGAAGAERAPAETLWVLEDVLTGRRLAAPGLALVDGRGARPLETPFLEESDRNRPGANLAFLRNSLPGSELLTRPCSSLAALPARDRPTLAAAWASGIRGVTLGEERGTPLADAWVDAWLLDPATWRATLDVPLPDALEAMAPRGSHQHRLLAYDFLRLRRCRGDESQPDDRVLLDYVMTGRLDDATSALVAAAEAAFPLPHVRTRSDVHGRYSLVLPGSGLALVRFAHPERVVHFVELETAPGAFAEVASRLPRRPRIRVLLLDTDGSPIPNHRVKVLVRMDPSRFDASELGGDGRFAQVAVGAPGRLETCRIRTRTTDDQGRAFLTAPWGRQYAAQAVVDDEFLFATAGPPGTGRSEVDLVLRRGEAQGDRGRLTVFDRDGRPLAGAELRLGIPGDPWQRQFPPVRLDEQGSVVLAWVPKGTDLVGVARFPEGDGPPLALAPFTWSPPTSSTSVAARWP